MSLITEHGRISVRPFAKVPPLGDLPGFIPAPASVSTASSSRGEEPRVDLSEGCLVTKSLKYTHQPAHWINAVRREDPTEVENTLDGLHIIPYKNFGLGDPCNLTFLEPFIHSSLDLYAFIAVTPSLSTLDYLITMVQSDNHRRQVELDATGSDPRRYLNFSIPSFTDPEYELVAMYPEHFLPVGSVLPIYDPVVGTCKYYVPARDRVLRESPEPNSHRLPPFHHSSEQRRTHNKPNIFLVAINAEIKFRRYFKKIQLDPPSTPLPDDVLHLMHRTQELIEHIYWDAKPAKGSEGELVIAQRLAQRRRGQGRTARPNPMKGVETSSSEGSERGDMQGVLRTSWEPPWPKDADLETRMAYGRALMSGYDRDYDPELFEDTFPIDGKHLYSDNVAIEAWNQGVSSPHGIEEGPPT